MDRFMLILLGVILFAAALTGLLYRLFKRIKWVKYVPAVISFLAAATCLVLAKTVHQGFQDLAYAVLAVMLFTSFVASLGTSLVIDYILPRFKH